MIPLIISSRPRAGALPRHRHNYFVGRQFIALLLVFAVLSSNFSVHASTRAGSAAQENPGRIAPRKNIKRKPITTTPVVSSLSPDSAVSGGPAFTLTVKGTNFVNGSVIYWNGVARSTKFVSPTQLTTDIQEHDIAVVGITTVKIRVANPSLGGVSSNAMPFTIGQILLKPAPLTRDGATNEIVGTIDVTNRQAFAADVQLTKATLRNLATGLIFNGAPVPQPIGMMGAGTSASATLRFDGSAGGEGTDFLLSVAGSYAGGPAGGGTFTGSFRLKAPQTQSSRVYTTSADFSEGSLINVVHSVADQLQLDDATRAFNFIWVAVSSKGTIVKINTETGAVLGEYRTAPEGQPTDPSRTTVDHNGSVWTANRAGNSVVRVGLLENGQCVDRNGNGNIETSGGLGDVRAWPNADGRDTDGGVETAADECVVNYVRVNSSGTRHVSVNKDNDVWVSGFTGQKARYFDLIDGKTGLIKRSEPSPVSQAHGGYGGLIDKSGVIWSANNLLRWDTSKPLTGSIGGSWQGYSHDSYGLCIDSKGNVWNTQLRNNGIHKFAPDGTHLGTFSHGAFFAQGCVVDKNDDVWIAHSLNDGSVGHLKNDGTFVGNVIVGGGPTGVSVDAAGKIWATNYHEQKVARINPQAGPIGADGVTRVGERDLMTVDLGGLLYNYSDMTGSTLAGAPGEGTWSTVYDSGIAGAEWGRIGWTASVCGDGALSVAVASGEDGTAFGPPVGVASGDDPGVANGRYLKISVSFRRAASGESPVLYDLSVGTQGFTLPEQPNSAPSVNAGKDQTLAFPEPATLHGFVCDDSLPAGTPLAISWEKVSGPGSVSFGDINSASTTATFGAPGTYVLRLTGSDSQFTSADDVTITVSTVNQPPKIISVPVTSYQLPTATGSAVVLNATVRDFNDTHPDFEKGISGLVAGLVRNALGSNNKPAFALPDGSGAITSSDTFNQWYTDVLGVNLGTVLPLELRETSPGSGIYAYESSEFFPVDGQLFGNQGRSHNYHFTVELHSSFTYTGGEVFQFAGDDDVWVFINKRLAVDLGGVHGTVSGSVNLDSLGLTIGEIYSFDFFFAERHTHQSNFKLQTSIDLQPDRQYTYPVKAIDSDGDTLTYSLVIAPDGMKIDSSTGLVTWNPGAGEVGLHNVTVEVSDGRGGVDTQSYVLQVTAPVSNQSPVVDAGPDQTITLPDIASLNATVSDDGLPAGSTITTSWSKVSGPGTVTFDNPNVTITAGSFSAPGTYVLRLTASDSQLTSSDDVTVTVNQDNQSPVVNAGPDQIVAFGSSATLSGAAADDGRPAGSTLSVSWTKVSGPGSVTFGNAGQPATTATFSAGGRYVLRLSASDSQLTGSDDLTVTVNQAPTVNAGPDQTITMPGTATLNYTVGDDGLPAGSTTVTWTKVSGPGSVTFEGAGASAATAAFTEAGDYVLRLTADDSHLSAADEVSVAVNPAAPPPAVSIISPADESELTTRADVIGSVSGGAWKLEHSLTADEGVPTQWTTFAAGVGAVSNARLGVFDPTLLLNGRYLIRLSATNAGGQIASASVSVVVSEEQKVGNFTVSFSDLSVPVAGLPIEVVRTYDSRDKRVGDFGVGWTLGIRNVRVHESRAAGAKWLGQVSPGFVPAYCITPAKPHVVTVTVADNRVYKFEAVINEGNGCQLGAPLREVTIGFRPLPGTNASLAAVGAADPVIAPGPFPGAFDLLDGNTLAAADYDQYQLTLEDGTILIVDQHAGLQRLIDTNGNTLTVTPGGVVHSSGKSITFARDAQGRITQITDPAGNALIYAYDASGDLVNFKDPENNVTTFTYNSAHGLLTIKDPRGLQPLRNEYDGDGRLISQTDAFGKVIRFTHDLGARQEVITDRLGNATVYAYDVRGNVLRVQDAQGNVVTRTYDARDNLLTETDAFLKTVTYTYDAQDNRTSETDALGNTTRHTYNGRGQVLTTTDPAGRTTTYAYDANGNQTSVKTPLGHTTAATFAPNGLQTSDSDALGNTRSYEYDAAGNLTKQTDPLGNVTTYAYDANGNQLSSSATRTTPAGVAETLTTAYEYDRLNRQTKVTYPDGSTTETVYNSIGKQAATVDQLGRRTTYDYDEMGRLARTTYPDNTKEESEYDAEGRRIKSTDRAGRATSYAYDSLGRLVKSTYPDNTSVTTAYDAAGRIVVTSDALGNATRFEYDAAGRRTKATDALSNATVYAYDTSGNQISVTDAKGQTTGYEYDTDGRRTRVVHPDGSSQATAYDPAGQATARTDQAGNSTQFEYDKLARLVKVTDALGGMTRYAYDEVGNRLTQTDANNHTTGYEYDRLGRRTRRTLPLGMSETYAYDAAGNLTQRTDFRARTTAYAYDAMDRLVRKTPDASLGQPPVVFTYTSTGRRATMADASGLTAYAYDLCDRLKSKATPHGTLTYAYDAAGNELSLRSSNAGGITADYAYDALNRLASVTDNRLAAGTTRYAYDANGNLESVTYPNEVRTSYAFNSLNRLTNVGATKGTTLASYAYTLGAAGNRVSVAEAGGRAVNYTYDALFRLTGESVAGDAVVANNGAINYTYDAVGNRLARASTVAAVAPTTSTYDANDRLTSDAYDPNGNTTASGGNTYQYDFENRLTSLNGGSVTFIYDGDGNRVAKTVGGVTTRYLVDTNNHTGHAQVVEELVNSSVRRAYTYGLDLISQTQLIGGASTTHFYGYDGHGSTRYLTDSAGTVTDTYTYDAFGNLTARTGTTPNDYLYSGEQYDADLGFYYLRARFMNPALGRFINLDIFEGHRFEPISLHKYLYANADPVNRVDPSGHFGEYSLSGLTTSMAIGGILNAVVFNDPRAPLTTVATNLFVGALEGAVGYFAPIAVLKGVGRLGRAVNVQRVLPSAEKVFSKIGPGAGPLVGGTGIPKYFVFNTSVGQVFITPNATKHITEEVIETGGTAVHTRLAEALIVKDLEYAIIKASTEGIEFGVKRTYRTSSSSEWELIFTKETATEGNLVPVVLKHAILKYQK